jgi:hypothetical protein
MHTPPPSPLNVSVGNDIRVDRCEWMLTTVFAIVCRLRTPAATLSIAESIIRFFGRFCR